MRKSQEDGGFAKKVSGSRAGHGDSTTTGMRHNNGIGQNTLSAPAHGVSVPDRRNHQTSHGTSRHYRQKPNSLFGEAGSGKTRLLRLVNSLYLRNDGDREIFEIPLRSWKNSLYGGMQEASGTVVILDDLAGSNGVQSEQDAKKLKELIMALGNGALPLRGTEGKESRVDFLAAVTANSILDYTLEILERICIVCGAG